MSKCGLCDDNVPAVLTGDDDCACGARAQKRDEKKVSCGAQVGRVEDVRLVSQWTKGARRDVMKRGLGWSIWTEGRR